jgi:hypothetical protein
MPLKKRRTEEIAKKKTHKNSHHWYRDKGQDMVKNDSMVKDDLTSFLTTGQSKYSTFSNASSLEHQQEINMKLYQGSVDVLGNFASRMDTTNYEINSTNTGTSLDSSSKTNYEAAFESYSGIGITRQIQASNSVKYTQVKDALGTWMKDPSTFLTNDPHYSGRDPYGYTPYNLKDTCKKRKEPWSKK